MESKRPEATLAGAAPEKPAASDAPPTAEAQDAILARALQTSENQRQRAAAPAFMWIADEKAWRAAPPYRISGMHTPGNRWVRSSH